MSYILRQCIQKTDTDILINNCNKDYRKEEQIAGMRKR